MRIRDLLAMGFKNLWRRKARSFLTIFGVIIGATSIVLMVSLGLGQERQTYQLYESFGDIKTIRVMDASEFDFDGPFLEDDSKNSFKPNKKLKLNDAALKQFESIEGVDMVVGFSTAWGSLKVGKYKNYCEIIGVDLEKFKKMNVKVVKGAFPNLGESQVLAGEEVQSHFFDPKSRRDFKRTKIDLMEDDVKLFIDDEIGEKGKKRPVKINVSGLTHRYGEYGYSIVMDLEMLKKILQEELRKYPPSDAKERKKRQDKLKDFTYNHVKVVAKDINSVEKVQEQIKQMGYRSNSPIEYIKQSQKQLEQQKLTLLLIGSVSLFVAAIGIANTMIMSIYERTREIGVMKVLGAEVGDILKLFLLEAGIIGLLGGLLGSGCSIIGSKIINHLSKADPNAGGEIGIIAEMGITPAEASYVPLWLIGTAIIFSILVGLISGLIPAIKATKLSALEAIKTNA